MRMFNSLFRQWTLFDIQICLRWSWIFPPQKRRWTLWETELQTCILQIVSRIDLSTLSGQNLCSLAVWSHLCPVVKQYKTESFHRFSSREANLLSRLRKLVVERDSNATYNPWYEQRTISPQIENPSISQSRFASAFFSLPFSRFPCKSAHGSQIQAFKSLTSSGITCRDIKNTSVTYILTGYCKGEENIWTSGT